MRARPRPSLGDTLGRIAVQVHGCFWHQCAEHPHAPKANAEWWRLKFASIRSRDADTERMLRAAGWLPVLVWEHEDMAAAARRVRELDQERRTARLASAKITPTRHRGDDEEPW